MGFGSRLPSRGVQPIFAPVSADCNRKWHWAAWKGKPVRVAGRGGQAVGGILRPNGLPLYGLATERPLQLEGESVREVSTMRSGHLCQTPRH